MSESARRPPDWWPVARWEFLRVVKRGDFLVSLFLAPLLVGGITVGSALLAKRAGEGGVKLALVSSAPRVTTNAAPFDSIDGIAWVSAPAGADALERDIKAKRLDGAIVVPRGFADGESVRVLTRRSDPNWVGRLRDPLARAARVERALGAGATVEALGDLDRPVELVQRSVEPATGSERANRLAGFIMVALLIAAIYATAAYLGVSISGEKNARVTEVIVSAIRPQAWMDGKILAFTAIGLLMVAAWGGSVVALALAFAWRLPAGLSAGAIALDALYLGLGFAFFIALFAAILASVKDIQSTSKFQAYLYFLPMLPFLFLEPIIENAESAWSMGLSWVPLFSPTLMPARMALGAVAPWEHALAIVLLVAATWLMRTAAGHALRIGMLMYGKELNLPELVRWARSD
jgi:ABC-2 type transport system permease protein